MGWITFNAGIYSLKIWAWKARNMMHENHMVLTLDNVTYSKLVWKDAKEFVHDGKLYDVISCEKFPTHVKLSVYQDNHEHELLKKISCFIDVNQDPSKDLPVLIKKITSLVFVIPANNLLVHSHYTFNCNNPDFVVSFHAQSYLKEFIHPPAVI